MSDQVWKVSASPAQRWILLNLSHAEGQKCKGQQGRVFRRFMRALGIDAIDAKLRAVSAVSPTMASSQKPAVFALTAENIDYLKTLIEVERLPRDETIIGPLFDAIEEIRTAPQPDASIPAYDPASEDWSPLPEGAPDTVEAAVEKIVAALMDAGQAEAAAVVEGGSWDKDPAAPSAPAAT